MIVYLVRHGRAGNRDRWEGEDGLRPLDGRGRLQARALVTQFESRDVSRIFSSPAVRCLQTVEPLSEARAIPVEAREELAEGAGRGAALSLLSALAVPVVASVHGDLVEELLGEKLKKGATAVLDLREDEVEVLERLPPPAQA